MSASDHEEIERFLTMVGQPNLLAYYGLNESSTAEEVDAAVQQRRSWAQGQQANPKFKNEAKALIRQHRAIRAVLVDDFPGYVQQMRSSASRSTLDVLGDRIKAAINNGQLSMRAEATLYNEGRELGLGEAAISGRVDEVLRQIGARREDRTGEDLTAEASGSDLYTLLNIAPEATQAEVEAAYMERYRWARNLADLDRSASILHQLDQAWRVLQSPERRARYDQLRGGAIDIIEDPDLSEAIDSHKKAQSGNTGPVLGEDSGSHVVNVTGRPPPVEGLNARTLSVADGRQLVRPTPQLVVDAPSTVSLTVGSGPRTWQLRVRNDSDKRMPGRLTSTERWLELGRATLDPAAKEQVIPVTVRPSRMSGWKGEATVRIVTEHGQRAEIHFVVRRSAAFIPVAVLVMLAILGGTWMALRGEEVAPGPLKLQLAVKPYADRVLMMDPSGGNGTPQAGGPSAFEVARQSEAPMTLRIETRGFATETLAIPADNVPTFQATVTMRPDSSMTFEPPAGARAAKVAPEVVVKRIKENGQALGECLDGSVAEASAIYRVWVLPSGLIDRVDVQDANFDPGPAQACINRVFRGIRVSSLPAGSDYAVVTTPTRIILSAAPLTAVPTSPAPPTNPASPP